MNSTRPDPLPRFTPRVVLRRMSGDDLPDFQAYRHDPAVGRYQSWEPQTDEEARTSLEYMAAATFFPLGQWVQMGIARREDGRLLGDIGVCVDAAGASAEIGFSLARQAQGQGLATEALCEAVALLFECTAIARLVGIADERNLASIRLLERLGMRRAAVQNAIFRGEPCVEYVYERLR